MTKPAPLGAARSSHAAPAALVAALLCAACVPASEPDAPRDGTIAREAAGDGDAAGFETFTDTARGLEFRYPRDLGTAYLHPVDWPPTVTIGSGPLACAATGNEIAAGGRTEPRTIGGRSYCVTQSSEGAAGSVYTTFEYALAAASRVVVIGFVLRAVQCANYDEPQRQACEAERAAFDVDALADGIARTLVLER